MLKILVINPGSTSTKVAVYEDEECVFQTSMRHPDAELARFSTVLEQYPYRLQAVRNAVAESGHSLESFVAIAARGGLLRPLAGGTYLIDREMYADLSAGRYGEHISNLAPLIAYNLGREYNLPGYVVDPVSVDEFHELARFSGLPELPRVSKGHALNLRAVAREVARRTGLSFSEINLVAAHLGSGISVACFTGGKMIDVSDPNREGPFSIERCGTLPAEDLIALCYSGKYTEKELRSRVTAGGGLSAYLGTKDFGRVEKMIAAGNGYACTVVRAMCYQVAKEIGAMAAVLSGKVDRIVLTGGLAYSRLIVDEIIPRVKSIAEVVVIPGEREMEALALGVLRVCRGEEEVRYYGKPVEGDP